MDTAMEEEGGSQMWLAEEEGVPRKVVSMGEAPGCIAGLRQRRRVGWLVVAEKGSRLPRVEMG